MHIDDDRIAIRRVEYDIEREVRTLAASGCPDAKWIAAMLRTGERVPIGAGPPEGGHYVVSSAATYQPSYPSACLRPR